MNTNKFLSGHLKASAFSPNILGNSNAEKASSISEKKALFGSSGKHESERVSSGSPPASAAAAGGGLSAVKDSLGEAGERLRERGEKLSQLSEKTSKLSSTASDFADLAKKLNQQKSSWW
jgi:hypothetical protein